MKESRTVSYSPFRSLMLKKSSSMKTTVDVTLSFMLVPFSCYRKCIKDCLKERQQATFLKWQPGQAYAPLYSGCLQLFLAPCLMWMTKQEEGNVGNCNMGWLGSEALICTCWEKFHRQRSSDDNVESSRGVTVVHSFAHIPKKKLFSFQPIVIWQYIMHFLWHR